MVIGLNKKNVRHLVLLLIVLIFIAQIVYLQINSYGLMDGTNYDFIHQVSGHHDDAMLIELLLVTIFVILCDYSFIKKFGLWLLFVCIGNLIYIWMALVYFSTDL